MNTKTRAIVLSILVILSVGLAGCADGWGEDGPAGSDEPDPTNDTDAGPPEQQQNNSTDTVGNENPDTDPEEPLAPPELDSDDESQPQSSDNSDSTDDSADSTNTDSSQPDDSSDSTDSSGTSDSSDQSDQTDDTTDSTDETDDSQSGDESDTSDSRTDDNNTGNGDEGGSGDNESSNNESDLEDRDVHTLTVRAGPGGSMAGIPVTIERHADGATTTRETNENGVVEFSVYTGDYTVSATDPGGNTDEQQVSVYGDAQITLNNLEPGTTDQYAYPDAVEVVSVEHDTASEDLDVDTVTIVNTHEELPVSIANWRVKTQNDVPTASLEGGEVLSPGEERTIQLRSNSLHPDGGILTLYDGNLDYVGQHSYAGSPGAPPASGGNETTSNETSPNETVTNESAAV